jgi:D-alanyl-D-alanine carboxypeptidase
MLPDSTWGMDQVRQPELERPRLLRPDTPCRTRKRAKTPKQGAVTVALNILGRVVRNLALPLLTLVAMAAQSAPAAAEAMLLVDVASGRVLHAENATYPWYPASLTKLMTTYVTLQAIRQHRIAPDTIITVSERAHAEQPSKMGFAVGTELTVDNALKMLLVKSANDMAVTLAEGVSGSVENFAVEMNAAAQRLGMTQTHYVNPNGLPDARQITSARDLAILARALIRDFPQYDLYWHIPAIKFGKRVMRNHNKLIGRYAGADGMKTGFICASGFNVVATATRHGRRLLAVVLGAPSTSVRAEKTAQLLESGFSSSGTLSWLTPSLGIVDSLQPIDAAPPNLYDETCGPHRRRPVAEAEDEEVSSAGGDPSERANGMVSSLQTPKAPLIGPWMPSMPPIVVSIVSSKGRSKVAAVPPPAAPAPTPKPEQIAPHPIASLAATLAGAARIRPSAFSNTALAANPPAAFAARTAEIRVPLPRPRPYGRAKKHR